MNLENQEHDWYPLSRNIELDGPEAKKMWELALQNEGHWQKASLEIAPEACFHISTVYPYRVQSELNNLWRYIGQVKVDRIKEHMWLHVNFADWGLK